MAKELHPDIALALSGGGVRAMVFHLGALKYLAEIGLLERVVRVSTVSGGSLLIGLMMQKEQESGLKWPTSAKFKEHVYDDLREKLCSRSLMWGMVRQLLCPTNWRYLLSRANLLAKTLESEWKVSDTLAALPQTPEWSINGTSAEIGKRFRFKKDSIGDYVLGYAIPEGFHLSNAMAVSAAFPGGIGPLALDVARFKWKKRPYWDAPESEEVEIQPPFPKLHLYDGGVYDNLGLEPLFDASKRMSKNDGDIIIASDAGAPLDIKQSAWSFNPWRFKRLMDIMSSQSRAMRVRTFIAYLKEEGGRGAYLDIATPLIKRNSGSAADFTCRFPTTLRRLSIDEFDKIATHGYEVTKRVADVYGLVSSPPQHKA